MCKTDFIERADSYKRIIAELKKDSSYYPIVLQKQYGDTLFVSTLVRIEREGKWYTVHCVETMIADTETPVSYVYRKLMENTHNTEQLYEKGHGFEDLDTLQISEQERLKELYQQWMKR